MKDVFDSFSIGDFVFQSENMTYSEFLAFCKSVLDEIEKLNLSDNGFYKEKKNSIVKLYRFTKLSPKMKTRAKQVQIKPLIYS